MAEEQVVGGGGEAVPSSTSAPEPSPSAGGLESTLAAAAEGAPETRAYPEPPAGAPAAEWQGVRDYAKAQGIELPYGDDVSALAALLTSYRQGQTRDYYSDLGRRVAPHANELSEFLRARQQQAQAPQSPPAWEPPPFRKEWLQQVERDPETGLLRAKAGYDPGLVDKVQAYADWQDRFRDSPESVIAPLVEDRARKLIREELGQHQQQILADSLVAQGASWLFRADASGNPAVDNQGRRQLSPAGALYARAAGELWQAGLRDVRQVHALARDRVENAVLRQQLLALQPAPAGTPAAQAPASVGGGNTRPSASAPPTPPATQQGLSLRERLNDTLKRFPDDAVA